jgi:hypothetical protein
MEAVAHKTGFSRIEDAGAAVTLVEIVAHGDLRNENERSFSASPKLVKPE